MTRLAAHFREKAQEPRVTRVWSDVDARLSRVQVRRRWLQRGAFGLVLSGAVALVVLLVLPARDPQRTAARSSQVLALADGSRVEHDPADRVEIEAVSAERVELRMTRGRALFRVTPNRARTFLTHAVGYTIRVVGTEYSVDLRAGVEVSVMRGEVEVRRDGTSDVWRVRAGERWSSTRMAAAAPAPVTAPPPVAALPSITSAATAEPEPTAPKEASKSKARRSAAAAAPARDLEAAALFQRAQDARVAGQAAQSVQLLAEFLRRFPDDARAGLVAFQLGRARLELGDARGALEALNRADSAGDAFREQVEARRVQALEAVGDLAGCRAARALYLRAHAHGTFAEVVRHRCP